MIIVRAALIVGFLLVISHVSAQGSAEGDIVGTWLTEDKSGEIVIYKSKELYFGKIRGGSSDEHYDVHNPDEARRNDPLVGLVILKDLRLNVDGEWKDGSVYDPKSGKTYSCMIRLLDKDKLRITGYLGFSWLGRSEVWERID